jgi:hypothetical protein
MSDEETVTPYRPVGPKELALMRPSRHSSGGREDGSTRGR